MLLRVEVCVAACFGVCCSVLLRVVVCEMSFGSFTY